MTSKPPIVLVVDDEADLREILRMDLEDHGFQVAEAHSGNSAIAYCEKNHVDLVLSDMRMSDGSGIDLIKGLRARHFEKPVVLFISGFSDAPPEEIYELGAGGILAKPWDVDELIEAIRRLLQDPSTRWVRKANRFSVGYSIEIKGTEFGDVQSREVINLGRGGMFVASDKELPPVGQLVEFSFTAPRGAKVAGHGVVRWLRHQSDDNDLRGYGVEFKEIDESYLQPLLHDLAEKKVQAFIPRTLKR